MLPADVLRQVRRLHLRARRLVQTLLGGEYHSAFKGAGLSFEEVREYQPGDDVRTIDWNVTARVGHPFIKRFVEERELTMILAVDVSASQSFGTRVLTKRSAAAELAALLALCAVSNNDRVGLLAFTSQVERFVPPNKGPRHVLRLLRDILAFEPKHTGTDLAGALDHLNKVQRRRAIVFFMSDFVGDNFAGAFRRAAHKHDLIAVRTSDPRERDWPAVGLVRLQDAETGRQRLVDTSDARVRAEFAATAKTRDEEFAKLARGCQADLIEAGTDGDHFDALLNFFRRRDRRRRHG
ncbi:hypothetical protein GobsT_72790 [Gemmata obscuriglobus]|uniref:DUF58 domain-containing protein n=1 Tax=Gemmata obscuriglobus TaxID=114 RepID=A0A2Z3HLZ4_9BACT|nr:DUF58 domain-containing protein [Gemmata obscuriglobus]AWM42510.1 DUF58 domain-containing protein [Gemmata obscuriglobus]QEG32424.1 hypothetical protein GobsT_72790 [Gemmata obscuriglobus]VTS11780.1 Uncharacterized protein OS=candidate division ZIXI bacterium RBG-1 GN=RBG1_1C00001G1778 PE=4 SV=1: DUF58 [Gemmata obscuriglobus UQM 2246]